ncbi:hypothetical protein Amsp01_044160 [Amycolatopsis sp. NBRC 101858]|nr:hypothetical protein Amsp01_044160 [Amycolatopsis sp. NBRC 101858]
MCQETADFGEGDGEVGVGQHGHSDVPILSVVSADLVVVETDFVFGGLEAFLDGPAGSRDANELGVVGALQAAAEIVGELGFLVGSGDLTSDEQSSCPAGRGVFASGK